MSIKQMIELADDARQQASDLEHFESAGKFKKLRESLVQLSNKCSNVNEEDSKELFKILGIEPKK